MYITIVNGKRGYKFKREQGKVYGGFGERKGKGEMM